MIVATPMVTDGVLHRCNKIDCMSLLILRHIIFGFVIYNYLEDLPQPYFVSKLSWTKSQVRIKEDFSEGRVICLFTGP